MGVGALLALTLPRMTPPARWLGDTVSVAGLMAIVGAAMLYDTQSVFPGWLAVVPVAGCCAVLFGGTAHDSRLAAVLSLRPLRALGRWSYAWYLWHWPVIGLALLLAARAGLRLSHAVTVGSAVALSLGLAALSHRFVERPLRYNAVLTKSSSHSLFIGLLLTVIPAVIATALISMAIASSSTPLANRSTPRNEVTGSTDRWFLPVTPMSPIQASTDVINDGMTDCNIRIGVADPNLGEECHLGLADSTKKYVIIGDSHAHHWLPAFHLIASHNDVQFIPHTKSACPPIDVAVFSSRLNRSDRECDLWRKAVIDAIASRYGTVDAVIIARSSGYRNFVEQDGERLLERDTMRDAWEVGATKTFLQWSEITSDVMVFNDTPWSPHDVPTCLAENLTAVERCSFSLSRTYGRDALQHFAEWAAASTVMYERSDDFRVQFVNPTPLVCVVDNCPMVTPNGIIKYRDSHHLTATYARFIAEDLWQLLPMSRQ